MYQTRYPDLPRVDIHTHVGRRLTDDGPEMVLSLRDSVHARCGADMALWIDLDGGVQRNWVQDVDAGFARIARLGKGRILPTISDSKPLQQLRAATPDQIASRAKQVTGWKWHCDPAFNGGTRAAHGLYDDPYFTPYYAAMERAGMPLLCLHFGAPLGNGWQQRDALRRVMDRHPDLIVIQAHFGAARTWGDLDDHAKAFEQHPNLYRDLSTTAQHVDAVWSGKEFAAFCTQYSDRLLYATDLILDHRGGQLYPQRAVTKYALQFEWLETANRVPTKGIGKLSARTPEFIPGLNLPKAALENIYYRNAVRLIPHVREAMQALGYQVGLGLPTPEPGKLTARAQRLVDFLPRIKPADIASMSAAQRAELNAQLTRIGAGA